MHNSCLFDFRQYMHSLDLIVFGIQDIKSDILKHVLNAKNKLCFSVTKRTNKDHDFHSIHLNEQD